MFTKAIVKIPCKNLVDGLTSADLGKPDFDLALEQHKKYINTLKECGLDISILDADELYPDSTFVEDTAILTPQCAVITNPGAPSRKGEIKKMLHVISSFYSNIKMIQEPGTLDGGDVMMAGDHFYVGLSERTNPNGASQLINILSEYGLSGSTVSLKNVLHLKSGVSYLGNNNLLLIRDFTNRPEFRNFNLIVVDDDESYAANSLRINDKILVPAGFPKTKKKIENAGYTTIKVDVSEFRKLDGGLSCLSLRF